MVQGGCRGVQGVLHKGGCRLCCTAAAAGGCNTLMQHWHMGGAAAPACCRRCLHDDMPTLHRQLCVVQAWRCCSSTRVAHCHPVQ